MFLGVDYLFCSMRASVAATPLFLMFLESTFYIVCDAGVDGAVVAQKKIEIIHLRIIPAVAGDRYLFSKVFRLAADDQFEHRLLFGEEFSEVIAQKEIMLLIVGA